MDTYNFVLEEAKASLYTIDGDNLEWIRKSLKYTDGNKAFTPPIQKYDNVTASLSVDKLLTKFDEINKLTKDEIEKLRKTASKKLDENKVTKAERLPQVPAIEQLRKVAIDIKDKAKVYMDNANNLKENDTEGKTEYDNYFSDVYRMVFGQPKNWFVGETKYPDIRLALFACMYMLTMLERVKVGIHAVKGAILISPSPTPPPTILDGKAIIDGKAVIEWIKEILNVYGMVFITKTDNDKKIQIHYSISKMYPPNKMMYKTETASPETLERFQKYFSTPQAAWYAIRADSQYGTKYSKRKDGGGDLYGFKQKEYGNMDSIKGYIKNLQPTPASGGRSQRTRRASKARKARKARKTRRSRA